MLNIDKNMCKFSTSTEAKYQLVAGALREVAQPITLKEQLSGSQRESGSLKIR